jgi:hypothetical protein
MKILSIVVLLVSFSSFAGTFECRDGDDVDTLILDKHVAKIRDLTLKNMLRVDWNLRLRSFAFIGEPWFDLEIDTKMLKGEKGYAYLSALNSRGQLVFSKYYDCNPQK